LPRRDPSPVPDSGVVRAAGGLVWRRPPDGPIEIVLVHRPAYDDWSFPKGKLHAGETEADAAVREVEEETGLRCQLGRELGENSYVDSRDRPKTVRYWEMTPHDGVLQPANEIDDARWVPLETAARMLTYPRDRKLLARFAPPT
jgi:8-oxo-dGTP diphosphatase